MFSLLNHFWLHNNVDLIDKDSTKVLTFFTLFKIDPYRKTYNTFDTINMVTITYNMPNFIYKSYLRNDNKKGNVVRNLYDYLMYNGDIILSDYNLLNCNTNFIYKEFDEGYLERILDFEEYDADNDLYSNYIYSYLSRNFLIMVGKQVLKDDDRYDEYLRLTTISVTLDLKKVIYEIIENFRGVLLNKYRKYITTEKVDVLVNVIYPIYQIADKYIGNHLNISVDYVYKEESRKDYELDCEDYDDEDCYDYYDDYDNENNDESHENIRYVNNLHLVFILDYVTQNLIFKANFKYWLEEIFGEDEDGIPIPADPFTLDIIIFKVHNKMKILLNVIIEKKVEKINKVSIRRAEVLSRHHKNIKYSINEDDNFYVIKIYDEFDYVENEFFVHLSNYLNDVSNHFDRIFALNIIK